MRAARLSTITSAAAASWRLATVFEMCFSGYVQQETAAAAEGNASRSSGTAGAIGKRNVKSDGAWKIDSLTYRPVGLIQS